MKKLILLFALFIFACSTDSEGNPCIYEPTLETNAVTDITETSATLNGVISIVSENCDVPNNTEQGFVYSTEIQPTLEDTQVNVNGTNISTTIEGLTPNTTYYVRAFLTNNLGDFYGDEVSFNTSSLTVDDTPPTIVLLGENPLVIYLGEDYYIEYGATATDNVDGDISSSINIDYPQTFGNTKAIYNVSYSATDSSGNTAIQLREVSFQLRQIQDNQLIGCDGEPVPRIMYESTYGSQQWAVENACHTNYRDGTPIPQITDSYEWSELTTGAYCYKNNDESTGIIYYNWYAVMGIHDNDPSTPNKEFAPNGWHVPSKEEWTTLEYTLVQLGFNYNNDISIAEAMASNDGWNDGGVGGTGGGTPGHQQLSTNNLSEFNAFPNGLRAWSGLMLAGTDSWFWSSSLENQDNLTAIGLNIKHNSYYLIRQERPTRWGLSVRLVKD